MKVYRLYQEKLVNRHAMDFDDLIMKCVELFETNEDIRWKYQEAFRYVLVDEYQDTNAAQYRLIRRLTDKHQNLCVVGDDDQSIDRFRGAELQNILSFEADFPSATVIRLEQNYRSILQSDIAGKVIEKMPGGM
jgi:DNA helicase-2/ATP-dependent DNA helicase PcrA